MENFIQIESRGPLGIIRLDRPNALNSLSLSMIRAITKALLSWQNDEKIKGVLVHSDNPKAFCAGGDIRFFYEAGNALPSQGSAQLEDFFTEEYALNHLIHHYSKPYIALANGVIMGGGMGLAMAQMNSRILITTEKTKMAMPEVNIGLFPDVGGSFFLNSLPENYGLYLALTGNVIQSEDAIHCGLSDTYLPSQLLNTLIEKLATNQILISKETITSWCNSEAKILLPRQEKLSSALNILGDHLNKQRVQDIFYSLKTDSHPVAQACLETMKQRSPLAIAITFELLKRTRGLSLAQCLRIERSLVRKCFEHREVIEGIRALVIDKDNTPRWKYGCIDEVEMEFVISLFDPVWPHYAHPLRELH